MKFFLLTLMVLPICAFSQSKFNVTGNTGVLSLDKEIHLLLNASINYDITSNFRVGLDTYVSPFEVNNVKNHNNQFYAVVEYRIPKLNFLNNKLYISLIGGPGIINIGNKDNSKTEYSTILASKINYNISKKTTIGLKQGFLLNDINNAAFVGFFINYSF
jgi:hypothetical protein